MPNDYRIGVVQKDKRGYLMEFANEPGQIFVARSHPGAVRGNHYHTRKIEKFTVVQGQALLQVRQRCTNVVEEHWLTGDRPEVYVVPPHYVHALINEGTEDAVIIAWASEVFNPQDPDTFSEDV